MHAQMSSSVYPAKAANDAVSLRLERIGWSLFVIMVGGLLLLPEGALPAGTWLAGCGVILLGLNVARYLRCLRMSVDTIVLGIPTIVAGVAAYLGASIDLVPIVLILVGLSLIFRRAYPRTR